MASNKRRWLNYIQSRLQLGLFLKSLTDWCVVFCLFVGCIFLLTKIFWVTFWPHALWLLLFAIPVVIGAWRFSRQWRYRDQQSVALLDQQLNAGGLLMTVVETPDDQWEQHLPQAEKIWRKAMPVWRPLRALKMVCLPILFLVVTCLIPPRTLQSLATAPSVVSQTEVTRLAEMLEEFEENEILEDEQRDEIAEQIAKLEKDTRNNPLTHEDWETVDAIQKQMELQLANRENQMQQLASALSVLQQSVQNRSSDTESNKEQLENLLEKLANASQTDSQSNNPSDSGGENGDLSKFQSENGDVQLPMDMEDLAAALQELENFIQSECDKVGQCKGKLKPCDCDECPEGGL